MIAKHFLSSPSATGESRYTGHTLLGPGGGAGHVGLKVTNRCLVGSDLLGAGGGHVGHILLAIAGRNIRERQYCFKICGLF
jgi:hypothetical protein